MASSQAFTAASLAKSLAWAARVVKGLPASLSSAALR